MHEIDIIQSMVKFYEKNKEKLQQQAQNWYRNLSEEEKDKKKRIRKKLKHNKER